ncbi:hypothetical protein BDY21DRAFT_380937 [Lineolata rhizophorae]|uniref:Uncharacterized protein n=1 Tax=Lineolata rhizophorae TaxID=578093 RepID=A0A6A6NTD6_9PEZI|nr:hypothetical protein BDY21DRAFT_380937 [Lineolata rhizophorae]
MASVHAWLSGVSPSFSPSGLSPPRPSASAITSEAGSDNLTPRTGRHPSRRGVPLLSPQPRLSLRAFHAVIAPAGEAAPVAVGEAGAAPDDGAADAGAAVPDAAVIPNAALDGGVAPSVAPPAALASTRSRHPVGLETRPSVAGAGSKRSWSPSYGPHTSDELSSLPPPAKRPRTAAEARDNPPCTPYRLIREVGLVRPMELTKEERGRSPCPVSRYAPWQDEVSENGGERSEEQRGLAASTDVGMDDMEPSGEADEETVHQDEDAGDHTDVVVIRDDDVASVVTISSASTNGNKDSTVGDDEDAEDPTGEVCRDDASSVVFIASSSSLATADGEEASPSPAGVGASRAASNIRAVLEARAAAAADRTANRDLPGYRRAAALGDGRAQYERLCRSLEVSPGPEIDETTCARLEVDLYGGQEAIGEDACRTLDFGVPGLRNGREDVLGVVVGRGWGREDDNDDADDADDDAENDHEDAAAAATAAATAAASASAAASAAASTFINAAVSTTACGNVNAADVVANTAKSLPLHRIILTTSFISPHSCHLILIALCLRPDGHNLMITTS